MIKIGKYKITKPYFLAPMAGVSQMPFRRLALQMGAGLATTELISAKGLSFGNARTKSYLSFDAEIERPFSVQLFGGDAESMAIAAVKACEQGAEILDINMGCPVKKVTKTNAGSALMCDWQRASQIITAMLKATNYQVPITAKIRSGWDQDNLNYLEVGRVLAESGISALAIHPRTRAQGYSGKANWQHIAELKASLNIPIIGNGDILSLADALNMQKQTQCDAVMIGRAALGNPWIFRELALGEKLIVSVEERKNILLEHLDSHLDLSQLVDQDLGRDFNISMAIKSFRSHLMWYSKGLSGGAKFRSQVMTTADYSELKDMINIFFDNNNLDNNLDINLDNNLDINNNLDNNFLGDNIDYRQAFG